MNETPTRWGNFRGYYKFNAAHQRLEVLNWITLFDVIMKARNQNQHKTFTILDVGCNSGELTLAMTEVLASHPESPFADKCVRVLGLDLDINLIEGAKKKLYDSSNYQVSFRCGDIMNMSQDTLHSMVYDLSGSCKVDLVTIFSVTMWIHLNHGDEGLKFFFERISKCGQVVLVEPQPWKCYQSAVHRLRRCEAGGEFPHWKSIQLRSTEQIEAAIGSLLTSDARRSRYDLGDGVATAWGRKLLLYG